MATKLWFRHASWLLVAPLPLAKGEDEVRGSRSARSNIGLDQPHLPALLSDLCLAPKALSLDAAWGNAPGFV